MPASRPRLELVWPGKDQFLLTPTGSEGKPVWVDPGHPAAHEVRLTEFTGAHGQVNEGDPHADNLVFTGDSLDVLRVLCEVPEYRQHYRGKIKLIYCDPPFNSQQSFAHYDDWMDHSTWLSFMRDRLMLMKDLLAPGGSIWLHLDNYEVHRMRCLMDEVFGSASFLSTVIWQRTTAKSTAQRSMGTLYDTILVYAASAETRLNRVLRPYSEEYLRTKYSNVDERGRYRLDTLVGPGIRYGSSGQPWRGIDVAAKNLNWRAPNPDGVLDHLPGDATTQEKLDSLLEAGYIQMPKRPGGMPQFKRYLREDGGVAVGDLWTDITVLNSQSRERLGYSTQKPEQLIERILLMATEPGDTVCDLFAGSGTTAAAAHKMGRRWITADVLASTVDGYVIPRLSRVSEDSASMLPDDIALPNGFRTVTVGPSMYEVTPVGVMLAGWATNGKFARAVAGQLGFTFQQDAAPLCGVRGRMRLAVLDGAVGAEEIREIVAALGDSERVTVVAKVILPDAEEALTRVSRGSKIRKAPRDLLADHVRRARRANRRVPVRSSADGVTSNRGPQ